MRITILTYGSRGDVQPYAALAQGLQEAGHSVLLAAPRRFADFSHHLQIPFAPLPGDPEDMSLRLNQAGRNIAAMVSAMQEFVAGIAPQVLKAALAACRDADMIVHSFLFTTGGHSLARARGIPDVSLQTFPVFAPTRSFPNVAMAGLPPGALSYISHWLASQVFWRGGNAAARRLLKGDPGFQGIKLRWPFAGPAVERAPLLFAYSPHVLPRPTDWPEGNIHLTGYLFLRIGEVYRPPAFLEKFLQDGEPPVCVSFGSMVSQEGGRIDQAVRSALDRCGMRGIFIKGWGELGMENHGERFCYLDAAPHDWLLPQCQAIVHHGGAGTTAAGLRAGIPALIIPHAADQPFWGRRVAALGAGPQPLPVRRLGVEMIQRALEQTREKSMRERAQQLGAAIRDEDGVAQAVRLIEAW